MSILQVLIFFFWGTCFLSLALLVAYCARNMVATRGKIEHRLSVIGALLFLTSFLLATLGNYFIREQNILFSSYLVWFLGLLVLAAREIVRWTGIGNVYGGSLSRTLRLYFETRHYLITSSLVLLLVLPFWVALVVNPIGGMPSVHGVLAVGLWALALMTLAVGEIQFFRKMRSQGVPSSNRSVPAGRRDVVAAMALGDLVNLFLAQIRHIATSPASSTVLEFFESNPVLFEGCRLAADGSIDVEPVIRNLNRIPEENRIAAIQKSFSLLIVKLLEVYGSLVSSEWTEKTIEDCYRSVERRFRHTSAVPDILRAIPPGILENEKLAFLSKEELEARVKERTIELEESREQLRTLKDFHEQIVKNAPVGIVRTDKEGKMIFANPKAAHILGLASREDDSGEEMVDLFDISKALKEAGFDIESLKSMESPGESLGDGQFHDYAIASVDGTGIQTSIAVVTLASKQGKFDGLLLMIEDVTVRMALEEERKRVDKLQSIGTLAGGIAHDFNNILTGIMGNIGMARMVMHSPEEALEVLNEAERASARARGLTQQLLTFSRGGQPVKKLISIDELLEESTRFALRGSNVRPVYALPDDLWLVEADEGQMNQVIINLARNAREAMPGGGMLDISARNLVLREKDVLPLPAGKYIQITIADHGQGVPKENLPRMFEPYFSTKQRGSGLGLATCYSIIKNHSGHISIESEPGVGTQVHVCLPASDKPALQKEEPAMETSKKGKGRILVMDDDDMIREMLRRMLHLLGYEAELAGEGAEAVNKYREAMEKKTSFDAVIMDLTVPGGMGGKEATAKLLEMDPGAKAIVSSGYTVDGLMADYRQHGFRAVITKPYTIEQLDKVLRSVIEEKK